MNEFFELFQFIDQGPSVLRLSPKKLWESPDNSCVSHDAMLPGASCHEIDLTTPHDGEGIDEGRPTRNLPMSSSRTRAHVSVGRIRPDIAVASRTPTILISSLGYPCISQPDITQALDPRKTEKY